MGEIVPLDNEGEELMEESDFIKEFTDEQLDSEITVTEKKLSGLQLEKIRRKKLEENK